MRKKTGGKVCRRINLILLHRMSYLESNLTPSYFIYKNSDPEKLSDMPKTKKLLFLFSELGTNLIIKRS